MIIRRSIDIVVDFKNDVRCTLMDRELAYNFLFKVCPMLVAIYSVVLNRYFTGQVTTQESQAAAQTMNAVSITERSEDQLVQSLHETRLSNTRLANQLNCQVVALNRLERESSFEMEEATNQIEMMKSKLQECFLDITDERCKSMVIQAFVQLGSYMLMSMGSAYNRFGGLRQWIESLFNIDIGACFQKHPSGVLGQVRIKVRNIPFS